MEDANELWPATNAGDGQGARGREVDADTLEQVAGQGEGGAEGSVLSQETEEDGDVALSD